ncbi:MAG: antiterminator LoaP [Lachnospiraceae bacterium]|nr:antiterminator LoaP [Lachnospiraceae bacterium]
MELLTEIRLWLMKWYVTQTIKGKEEKLAEDIRQHIVKNDEDVFIMESEKEYRIRGEWLKGLKPLFPGYIFIVTAEPKDFNIRLRKKFHTVRLLDVDGEVTPITDEEQEYLMQLGGEKHIVNFSKGIKNGDKVEILSGPFKGYKGEIVDIDRHHRIGKLVIPLMKKDIKVEIGLEIVEVVNQN